MSSHLDCTIVILSYNSKAVTDTCLAKIDIAIKQSKKILGNTINVIVVDNASSDGSVAMIQKKYPAFQLMAQSKNIGYAAGNNLAMKKAHTPYILLMNSDTYIQPDTLVKAFRHIEHKTSCDVLTCRYLSADGSLQGGGGFLPTPLRIILWSMGFESIPILRNFIPRIYGHGPKFFTKENTTEWYPPCFFLIKRKVYDLTKGFDEDLFFHMVDAEWCHRIHKKGLTICFTPTIEVTHLFGASSKDLQKTLTKDNFKGLMHFCKTHYPHDVRLVAFILRIGLRLRSLFYLLAGNQALSRTYKEIVSEI